MLSARDATAVFLQTIRRAQLAGHVAEPHEYSRRKRTAVERLSEMTDAEAVQHRPPSLTRCGLVRAVGAGTSSLLS